MDVLENLFEQYFHSRPERIEPLRGELGGSGRRLVRLADERHSAIGVVYGVREENVAFLEFSRHFRRHGLPVPEIYAENLKSGAYLEEARSKNPTLAVVIMLSDPNEPTDGAPADAVRLVKPFDLRQLAHAIDEATSKA